MWLMFKTKKLIFHLKANFNEFDVKILFRKITHPLDAEIRHMQVWEQEFHIPVWSKI